jgi:hypothetical protein
VPNDEEGRPWRELRPAFCVLAQVKDLIRSDVDVIAECLRLQGVATISPKLGDQSDGFQESDEP